MTFRPEEEVFCVDHGILPTGTSNPPVRPGVWKCVTEGCDNESVRRGAYERHLRKNQPDPALPGNEERRCREGHTYVTSAGEPGRCWCGASAALEEVPHD